MLQDKCQACLFVAGLVSDDLWSLAGLLCVAGLVSCLGLFCVCLSVYVGFSLSAREAQYRTVVLKRMLPELFFPRIFQNYSSSKNVLRLNLRSHLTDVTQLCVTVGSELQQRRKHERLPCFQKVPLHWVLKKIHCKVVPTSAWGLVGKIFQHSLSYHITYSICNEQQHLTICEDQIKIMRALIYCAQCPQTYCTDYMLLLHRHFHLNWIKPYLYNKEKEKNVRLERKISWQYPKNWSSFDQLTWS